MRGPFEHLHVEVRQRMADVHDLHDGAQIGTTLQVVADQSRSEEHTSELQSLMRISYAVFCLQKKNRQKTITYRKETASHRNDRTTKLAPNIHTVTAHPHIQHSQAECTSPRTTNN